MAEGIKEEKINPASAEGQVGNASGDPTMKVRDDGRNVRWIEVDIVRIEITESLEEREMEEVI